MKRKRSTKIFKTRSQALPSWGAKTVAIADHVAPRFWVLNCNCTWGGVVHVKTHKLLQVCKQVVTSLFTSCRQVVFAPSCSNKFDTVMINKNVTRLTTQGCNNTAISWLYRTCWNNCVTSLIININKGLLEIVNSLFQTCWQLGTSIANTSCWQLVGRLATRCEIFTSVEECTCFAWKITTCVL
jgi:hypothetical protein